jgi:protein MAK11
LGDVSTKKKTGNPRLKAMAPFAPGKKRKVAFENDAVASGSTTGSKVKKRKLKQSEKKVGGVEEPSDSVETQENLTFKIIAGSYEKILYGLEGFYDKETGKASLKPIFIFPAHLSCIKSVAASPNGGKWLVSGSADEIIRVWDLRRRKEVGGLIQHEGESTLLFLYFTSHRTC